MSESAEPAKKNEPLPLAATAISLAEYKTTSYVATATIGTSIEDIVKPKYWTHVAAKFRPLDEVKVYWEDGSRYAHILVTRASRVDAHVVVLVNKDLKDVTVPVDLSAELANYEIGYAGPQNLFRVIYRPSRAVLKGSLQNEDAARAWLLRHLSEGKGEPAPQQDVPSKQAQK